MITLYHGSNVEVRQPDVNKGRKNLDFGPGFYVTKMKDQAQNWAQIIASRKGRRIPPIISIYTFNLSQALKDGVNICFV